MTCLAISVMLSWHLITMLMPCSFFHSGIVYEYIVYSFTLLPSKHQMKEAGHLFFPSRPSLVDRGTVAFVLLQDKDDTFDRSLDALRVTCVRYLMCVFAL